MWNTNNGGSRTGIDVYPKRILFIEHKISTYKKEIPKISNTAKNMVFDELRGIHNYPYNYCPPMKTNAKSENIIFLKVLLNLCA